MQQGSLLALHELLGCPELRGARYEAPVRHRLLVDPRLVQGDLEALRSIALREAALVGDALSSLLEELQAAAHPADVPAEVYEPDLPAAILLDGAHELLDVGVRMRKAQVGAHVLHVAGVEHALGGGVEALEGGSDGFLLDVDLGLYSVDLIRRVPAGLDDARRRHDILVQLVVRQLEVRVLREDRVQPLLLIHHERRESGGLPGSIRPNA
mmetsp:Transcript_84479/g.239624  ORF Transcript_84479/g.239624 Transcript_84479/m.239624 type:complete len:211 (+) Transcript_84479:1600-2232(+)